jgi:hypothetical protein
MLDVLQHTVCVSPSAFFKLKLFSLPCLVSLISAVISVSRKFIFMSTTAHGSAASSSGDGEGSYFRSCGLRRFGDHALSIILGLCFASCGYAGYLGW